jgi:hypothetical protein
MTPKPSNDRPPVPPRSEGFDLRKQGGAFAVSTEDDAPGMPGRSGLSHAAAMALAESLFREGKVTRVMHHVGDRIVEVDRYPAR